MMTVVGGTRMFQLMAVTVTVVVLLSYQLYGLLWSTDMSAFIALCEKDVAMRSVTSSSSFQQQPQRNHLLSLKELVETQKETACSSEELVLVSDRFLDPNTVYYSHGDAASHRYNIPKIIHVTTKSRCLPKVFADNLNIWKEAFPDHSFLLHNDAAMERLLYNDDDTTALLFPHLTLVLEHCSISAAAKADLWRAVILYHYGGIYTDLDNAPRKFSPTSIQPTDQAWFVVEEAGYLSQYFMAAAPRHPLLYLIVQASLSRLLQLNDVEHQYVPYVTGPGAVKQAFLHFMHWQGANNNEGNRTRTGKVTAGVYTGMGNATVTVVGRRSQSDEYVARNVVYKKRVIYQKLMNMTHFSRVGRKDASTDSCMERMWKAIATSRPQEVQGAAKRGSRTYKELLEQQRGPNTVDGAIPLW